MNRHLLLENQIQVLAMTIFLTTYPTLNFVDLIFFFHRFLTLLNYYGFFL